MSERMYGGEDSMMGWIRCDKCGTIINRNEEPRCHCPTTECDKLERELRMNEQPEQPKEQSTELDNCEKALTMCRDSGYLPAHIVLFVDKALTDMRGGDVQMRHKPGTIEGLTSPERQQLSRGDSPSSSELEKAIEFLTLQLNDKVRLGNQAQMAFSVNAEKALKTLLTAATQVRELREQLITCKRDTIKECARQSSFAKIQEQQIELDKLQQQLRTKDELIEKLVIRLGINSKCAGYESKCNCQDCDLIRLAREQGFGKSKQ